MRRVLRLQLGGLFAIAVLVALAALAWGTLRAASSHSVLGGPAPHLVLRTFDGKSLSLASLRGKPVVLNFWASWCVPCRQEQPALAAAAKANTGKAAFVGVDIRDSDPAARAYLAAARNPYPSGVVVEGSYQDFGVSSPPETFFIDRTGQVVADFVGPVDSGTLALYLAQASR